MNCTLGVGCEQSGVRYADAHGQPEQCGHAERPPYPTGPVLAWCVCGSWPGGNCLRCEWIPAPPLPTPPIHQETE